MARDQRRLAAILAADVVGYASLHHAYNQGPGFDFLQDRIVRQCEQLCSQMTEARSGAPSSPLLPALRRLNDMIKGLFTQI